MLPYRQSISAGQTTYQPLGNTTFVYRKVAQFTSYPSLRYLGIPIDFPDQWSEEAFTVYDHPRVTIFEKTHALSLSELRPLFADALAVPAIPQRDPPGKSLMLYQPVEAVPVVTDRAWLGASGRHAAVAVALYMVLFELFGLIGWAAVMGSLAWPAVLIYTAAILWTMGYDTIYALQDIRDDSIIGVRSTARLFGPRVQPAVGLLFAGTVLLAEAALLAAKVGLAAQLGLLAFAAHLAWQVRSIATRR